MKLQVLTAAHVDSRFQTIKERTTGIAFFGTPHRGSEKAGFGEILASVATTVMHRPSSRLIGALQSNSDTLQRLNSDFRFQLVNYQILTFYETRALSFFSQPASLPRTLFLLHLILINALDCRKALSALGSVWGRSDHGGF